MKKRTLIGIVILLVALAGIGGSLFAYDKYQAHEKYENTKYINLVQGTSVGDTTFKTILNKVLYDLKWSQVKMTDNNNNAVEVTGIRNNHKITIDFEVTDNNGAISFDAKKNKEYAFEDGNKISYRYLMLTLSHNYITTTGDKISDTVDEAEKNVFALYDLTHKIDPEFKQDSLDNNYIIDYYDSNYHTLGLKIVQDIQDGNITKNDLTCISQYMADPSAVVDYLAADEETEVDRNTAVDNFAKIFKEFGEGFKQIK